jgi:hypothetical protein
MSAGSQAQGPEVEGIQAAVAGSSVARTPAASSAVPRHRWGPLALRLVVLALAAGLVFLFTVDWGAWIGSATMQSTNDAYLESDITPLAAKVGGYVRFVAVAQNRIVPSLRHRVLPKNAYYFNY